MVVLICRIPLIDCVSVHPRSLESCETLVADLRFYVENTPPARVRHVLYSREAGTIKIAGELGVLDKFAIVNHLLEVVLSHEVVVRSIGLSWSRRTGCV